MKYAYYPGCSLGATALPYSMSLQEIARVLDMDMPELEDWNCCGSTVYQALDEASSLTLAGRNLALAEQNGSDDLVTPCAACFAVMGKTSHTLATEPELGSQVGEALGEAGLSYAGKVGVRHLLDVLVNDVGLDAIRAKVTHPLTDLKVVCYYGCLLTRPPAVTGAAHPEYPMLMDRLVEALGAEALDWSSKTDCCGAALAVSRPDLVGKLSGRIMDNAAEVGATMIVAACPLCQTNLDMTREEGDDESMPVVYFTELMGTAFGLTPKDLGLTRHFRDPVPALCRYALTR